MTRCIAYALFAVVIVALAVYWSRERHAYYAMPLVQTATPDARPNMLFSPCPLKQQNLPRYRKVET
jgi:hypothetical protein